LRTWSRLDECSANNPPIFVGVKPGQLLAELRECPTTLAILVTARHLPDSGRYSLLGITVVVPE
jgi:hypothetical protein